MQYGLFYELEILSKSIQYKNLSAAAIHVGLSQPQLSRIIAKIEETLQVVLLDRSTKRKSGWTPLAEELSRAFEKNVKSLNSDISFITHGSSVKSLRIGTLEGLSGLAMKIVHLCFNEINVRIAQIDIYDLNDLEAHFATGDLDLILTSKTPGKKKYKYLHELGYQLLDKIETDPLIGVFSTFEYGQKDQRDLENFKNIFVSNSLLLRKDWLNTHGGTGVIPSEVKRGKSRESEPVYLIGSDIIQPQIWQSLITGC